MMGRAFILWLLGVPLGITVAELVNKLAMKGAGAGLPGRQEEWQRLESALAGWDDTIYTHLSATVPGETRYARRPVGSTTKSRALRVRDTSSASGTLTATVPASTAQLSSTPSASNRRS